MNNRYIYQIVSSIFEQNELFIIMTNIKNSLVFNLILSISRFSHIFHYTYICCVNRIFNFFQVYWAGPLMGGLFAGFLYSVAFQESLKEDDTVIEKNSEISKRGPLKRGVQMDLRQLFKQKKSSKLLHFRASLKEVVRLKHTTDTLK